MTTGFPAQDRSVLKVSGADAEKFLQDLVTNDITKDGLIYAALLTPQGKFLADFLIQRDENAYLLDTAKAAADGLIQRLSMYKLRADVTIDATDIAVRVTMDPSIGLADPRSPALGRRVYGDADAVTEVEPRVWDETRIKHVIPMVGHELIANDSFVLEHDFERISGVDFKKGCYVGQEVTARMKHKTSLRKGIAGVTFDEAGVSEGVDIMSDGKIVGTITSVAGLIGIAYLRFDRVGAEMTAAGVGVTLRERPAS